MATIKLTIAGGAGTTPGVGGISFTTLGSYRRGVTRDGEVYVIAPQGLTVSASSPAEASPGGRVENGIMKNPERSYTNFQALDAGGSSPMTGYDATKLAAYPISLVPNDTLIKGKAHDPLITQTREGVLDEVTGLHVVAAAKAGNVFAAPYVWPASDLANRPWRVADVDLLLSSLTTFNTSAQQQVTWAQLAPFLDHLNIGKAITPSTGPGGYEYTTIHPMGDNLTSNYDRYQLRTQALMLMGLMSQSWSTADKTAAAIRLLQRGCQESEAIVGLGNAMGEDGAHYNSQYAPAMAWLLATGRTAQYPTWIPLIGGNFYGQYYNVTAGQFTNHTSALLPYIARERTVNSIDSSGTGLINGTAYPVVISLTGYGPASGLAGDTASNATLKGLNLVRKTGGAVAYITVSQQGTGAGSDFVVGLAAAPTGLAVSDVVYCAEVTPMAVGTPDFTLRNSTTYPNLPNPSASTDYRDTQYTAIAHLFAHNLGMSGSQVSKAVAYLNRAMAGGSGLPTMVDTVTSSVTGSTNTWASEFWTAFSATLLAKTQIV